MDAGGAPDESASLRTAKSCGPDASTPASSFTEEIFREATVTRKPDHRGEREAAVKTIRVRECRVSPVRPW